MPTQLVHSYKFSYAKIGKQYSTTNLFHAENNILKATTNNVVTTSTVSIIPATTFTVSVLPAIINQGQIGDCVCNAFQYCITSMTSNKLVISRLFLYANSRIIQDSTLDDDCGTDIPTAAQALITNGICTEAVYPYSNDFTQFPILGIFKQCNLFKSFTYTAISQTITSIKTYLSKTNTPILIGINVYDSFMTKTVSTTGIVPMPNMIKENNLGGHCVVIVGYNDKTQTFLLANSWGTGWRQKGYFTLPYAYIINPKLTLEMYGITFTY